MNAVKIVVYNISIPKAAEYPALIEIWEAAVRTTHHFLQEAHIQHFRLLILNEYFAAVDLFCIRDEAGQIMGFSGLSSEMVEMLFIHPQHVGKGIGKILMQHAVTECGIRKVDVNEQNPDALANDQHCTERFLVANPVTFYKTSV
ncbi:GNAT family N-acetyltransferase [Dyadobacter sp. CY261]|uniref:GNAT family N-acetyltransferase n=1 Tax=Dyadobacter sp. CY261 TaxID=2907203 RepID=UPI001F3E1FD8|nr:GNAT family N-acetyltransferase [Dyadobacter sp. CY261]MCF0070221.1 GNAT family N-acetyltransferase [Dyadobacter sp. CY261]